jgi:Uma2 family endonuclease
VSEPAVDLHRWTRAEYEQMAASGLFEPGRRVELIDGFIFDMTPQSSFHATAVHLAAAVLRASLPGVYLRIQSPLALGADSLPEPDVAAVPGSPRDYLESHPATALLVVEVADSSLPHDRQRKLPLYAGAGIPETWILTRNGLEVYRQPEGAEYRSVRVLRRGDTVATLANPDGVIAVADLLP